MKAFIERQVDELFEQAPTLLKATLALVGATAVLLFLAFQRGLLSYIVALWVIAVVGGLCHIRPQDRPFGKGLLAAASAGLTLLPVLVFGALFRSMG